MQSFSIPVKSLDDLQKMTNFQLYIYGGGSIQTLLEKWAQSPKETDIWRQKAYQKFIKTGMEDDDKLKMIFDEMLNGDIISNVALLNDEDVIGHFFEQSITKYDKNLHTTRKLSWIYGRERRGSCRTFSLVYCAVYCISTIIVVVQGLLRIILTNYKKPLLLFLLSEQALSRSLFIAHLTSSFVETRA